MQVTKQQVFDAAWSGLKAQGFVQAIGEYGQPCAQSMDGRRCALNHVWNTVDANFGMEFDDNGIANDLRRCHDDATSPADMERNLREFAAARGLTVPGDEKPIPSVRERLDAIYAGAKDFVETSDSVVNPEPRLVANERQHRRRTHARRGSRRAGA
jgi:hypothetical protein